MRARRSILLGLVALAGACVTPTIPLPPPEPEAVSFELDTMTGQASFSYTIPRPEYGGARVFVEDETQGVGVIVTANPDGTVSPTPRFLAFDGDRVQITFKLGEDSAGICLILHPGPSSPANYCN